MPFTFSHPAAVLPLKRYCPKLFNFPALVIGSLMPDLGYYMHNWIWSISGHAFHGTVSFDVPAGLIFLALFYLFIRPVARLLPYPHREACSAFCPVLALPGLRAILLAAVSLMLGAWTHIIWDGFTHENGWCVRQFASMTPTLFMLGSYRVTVWHFFQHASTFLGLYWLVSAYLHHVHGKRFLKHQSILGGRTRSVIWALLLTLPAVRAVLDNIVLLSRGISLPGLDQFIFGATVTYVCSFLPLACAAGVIVSVVEYFFSAAGKRLTAQESLSASQQHLREPVAATAAKQSAIMSVLAPSDSVALPVEGLSKRASV